ncbi:uncharacterized protein CC84DRAFT_754388 [Paraphaeosphaeria sporulosa]|uniref:Copper transport protein n=1 Tax=Paraphaeosphaeria sporulosa TaxID=1460663 RepID=A0A177CH64_9PLEO|nr:uncharacterized protein CC84DRAFT_754388 [Paraphaeosphaeria sporulosa]OAG06198.1 hypothetical protein CC84DRAFT_754388 [Paraphaeosphaeria sporulosa]
MESMSMATVTSTMAGMSMSMPMATESATSGSMDMGSSSVMAMSTMAMTTWTPASAGQYAGTCIFLIAFAAIFRALIAIRFNFDRFSAKIASTRGDNQAHLYTDEYKGAHRPWRANEAVALGAMDVVIAGVSYLLYVSSRVRVLPSLTDFRMIAVMTMNVGYFLSVLAGVFIGSMAFGRFMSRSITQ